MSARPRFYTPKEVAAHNAPSDCWVSYLGNVYDLTGFCKEHAGKFTEVLLFKNEYIIIGVRFYVQEMCF